MRTALLLAAAFVVGVVAGVFASHSTINYLRRRVKALRRECEAGEKKRMETSKKVILACLINGFAWVWCSYVLACLDKTQIAESLSQVAVTEIIGVVLAYCIKSTIENLSKNNRWPDRHDAPEETENAEEPDDQLEKEDNPL